MMDGPQTPDIHIRRHFLSLIGIGGVFLSSRNANATQVKKPLVMQSITQPQNGSAQAFIERSFEMRQLAIEHGDQPYGAVVVKNGKIIGQSWSRVILDSDATGHAEMSAIRDAGRRAGRESLSGAILYSSSHPCAMCEAAASWVGIASMIHGHSAVDAGPPQTCS
jgi:tRNA(Arg) A34 adenosine deaminase TadA